MFNCWSLLEACKKKDKKKTKKPNKIKKDRKKTTHQQQYEMN